jgi:hypothetical protein
MTRLRGTLLASVLALGLSGCAAGQNTPGAPGANLVEQIALYTQQACGFLPAASAVSQLLAAFYPAAIPPIEAVTFVAQAICRAQSPAQTTRASTGVVTKIVQTPRGPVVVTGRYVR